MFKLSNYNSICKLSTLDLNDLHLHVTLNYNLYRLSNKITVENQS